MCHTILHVLLMGMPLCVSVFFLARPQQPRKLIMCNGIEGHTFIRMLTLAYISAHA